MFPVAPRSRPLNRIVVAVHGAGDQRRHVATLKTVTRFCAHYDYLWPVSHGEIGSAEPSSLIGLPSGPRQKKERS
jgi:hypothetical protein